MKLLKDTVINLYKNKVTQENDDNLSICWPKVKKGLAVGQLELSHSNSKTNPFRNIRVYYDALADSTENHVFALF